MSEIWGAYFSGGLIFGGAYYRNFTVDHDIKIPRQCSFKPKQTQKMNEQVVH